ncbi:MAG: hypothetical protein O3A10_00350 [Chloroflexi bacterium]|nr:hypothetical protein [Chloroflexota bacterium]MDA1145407.1 hypothetical protein [Chloroflexota bacterium]
MDEERFCFGLGRRISVEVAHSGRDELVGLSEDGIGLSAYLFDTDPTRLEGVIWFLGDRQPSRHWGPYQFSVDLSTQPRAGYREDLDFDALLPLDGVTGWLTVDLAEMRIAIDPAIREAPTEDILLDRWGNFTVIGRDAPGDDRRFRTHRTIVHGSGPPVAETSDRGPSRSGTRRHQRRTGKRRPPQ